MPAPSTARPRVVLLRGHHANVWDLRPWELLLDEYDVRVLVTGSNLHQTEGLALPVEHVRTPRDVLPGSGRLTGGAAYALGERYLGLDEHLRGAAIVHAAELGTWYAAQAAGLRSARGFRLALTVWETIAWRETYRWRRERAYRRAVLAATDLYLPTTERARDGLRLEGVPEDRMRVCPPGIDLARFADGAAAAAPAEPPAVHTLLAAGRLVWEKGHQDVLRAFAALRLGIGGAARADVRLLIVGDGPEGEKLRAYAADLGVGDAVEFRRTVPYDEMPALYARASALVLGSLPTAAWEEQFGMVLVEAMACGTPVVACASGAIPEVVGDRGTLIGAGDWIGMAAALREGPLAAAPATRSGVRLTDLERYSSAALADRLRGAYAGLLDGRSP